MLTANTQYPSSLVEHLDGILRPLRAMVSGHTQTPGPLQPLMTLIWLYLHRPAQRLARLIAKLQAGTLAPPRPRTAATTPPVPRAPKLRLPNRHAWLIRLVQRTAQLYPQLEILVGRPEMAELLAAAPQAGRILRPLCRMLGIRPLAPVLRLPPRPRRARPPKPAPTIARITARERRALLSYSPGRLRIAPNQPNPPRRNKFAPA